MQNLGNINININQGQNSQTGNGNPGGGPPPNQPNPNNPINRGTQGFLNSLRAVSSGFGELRDFISRPSLSGLTQLLSVSSTTGSAIAGLGAAAGFVLPVVGGLLAVVGGAVIGFGLLKAAAEKVAVAMQSAARFHGGMAFASAQERLRQFSRAIKDAEVNGALYAKTQFAATRAADMQAEAMLAWNSVLANLATALHNITALFWRLAKPVGDMMATVVEKVPDMLNLASAGLSMGGQGFLAKIADLLLGIYNWVFGIAQNTKPQPQAGRSANLWYINDLKAVTGGAY